MTDGPIGHWEKDNKNSTVTLYCSSKTMFARLQLGNYTSIYLLELSGNDPKWGEVGGQGFLSSEESF